MLRKLCSSNFSADMRYIRDIENKKYKGLRLCQAELTDYGKVFAFLDGCRNALDRIEFFYPYTEEELRAVLENGMFMCALENNEIVATCAVDTDEGYAKQLAEIIKTSTCGKETPGLAYEASGLMVREDHRGAGLASYMLDRAVEFAESRKINLCGVVHYLNKASMATFFGRKFLLSGIFEPINGYKFVYLLKKFKFYYSKPERYGKIDITEAEEQKAALQKGLQGFALDGDTVLYSEISLRA